MIDVTNSNFPVGLTDLPKDYILPIYTNMEEHFKVFDKMGLHSLAGEKRYYTDNFFREIVDALLEKNANGYALVLTLVDEVEQLKKEKQTLLSQVKANVDKKDYPRWL